MAVGETSVIPLATADVAVRQALTVFVRGSLAPHVGVLESLWRMLLFSRTGARLRFRRSIADVAWQPLSATDREAAFTRLLDCSGPLIGCRGVEFAERADYLSSGAAVRIVDLAPINGSERASHLRVLFDESVLVSEVVALAEWLVGHLPVWWGSAGFMFDYVAGPTYTAYSNIAALAKRYWCVDVQDIFQLEWDGLRGMSGVSWLNLIGDEFARSKEFSLDELEAAKGELEAFGVFLRRGTFGIALAAGQRPVQGDINLGQDVEPYVYVTSRIKPLLLPDQPLLFGPFAKPEVRRAWLGRFGAPRAWLESDITPE
jgi:hypothetical protein